MKKYKIVLLSGDGIGPEISEVSKKVLKKLSKNHNFDIEIIEKLFGGIAYEKYGTPAPDETLDQCKKSWYSWRSKYWRWCYFGRASRSQ